jgi:hypothetical protein
VSGGDKCLKCGVVVGSKDMAIPCELCGISYHAVCMGVDEKLYETMKALTNLHWFCDFCNTKIMKIASDLNQIQKRQDEMEDGFKELKTSVKEVKNKLEQISAEIIAIKQTQEELAVKTQVEELTKTFIQDEKWTDIVKRQVDQKVEVMTTEIDTISKMVVETKYRADEEKDREKRRKNVVIYRAQESLGTTYEERISDDKHLVKILVAHVTGIELADIAIVKVMWLGKKEESKVRPLLVQFEDMLTKNLLMANLSKLKTADPNMRIMTISHDMTQNERIECKKLVEEAKTREKDDSSGEWVYRVRGAPGMMKIVRWRKDTAPMTIK